MTIRSNTKPITSLFILILLAINPLNAAELSKKISMIIDDFSKKHVLRGTILVAQGEKVLSLDSFGFADERDEVRNAADTQYLIGSITKQFTAAALLKILYDKHAPFIKEEAALKEAIQKDLQKPVSTYLPRECAIWDGAMPDWADRVTLHHLLTQSSGLANFTNLPAFDDFVRKSLSISKLVTLFKNEKLGFNPGEKFSYSNSNYLLLGEIVQQMSGEALGTYLERVFFKPLQMTSTFLPSQGTLLDFKKEERGKKLAYGYEVNLLEENSTPYEMPIYWPMQFMAGAGGMISTMLDCLKWNNALYAGKAIPKLLTDLMVTPHMKDGPQYYGYGIVIVKVGEPDLSYEHQGRLTGFVTRLVYVPAMNLSIISFANIRGYLSSHAMRAKDIEIEKIKSQLPLTVSSLPDEEKTRMASQIFESTNFIEQRNKDKWLSTTNIGKEIMSQISPQNLYKTKNPEGSVEALKPIMGEEVKLES